MTLSPPSPPLLPPWPLLAQYSPSSPPTPTAPPPSPPPPPSSPPPSYPHLPVPPTLQMVVLPTTPPLGPTPPPSLTLLPSPAMPASAAVSSTMTRRPPPLTEDQLQIAAVTEQGRRGHDAPFASGILILALTRTLMHISLSRKPTLAPAHPPGGPPRRWLIAPPAPLTGPAVSPPWFPMAHLELSIVEITTQW